MVITCEKCGKSFKFDEKLIKPEGSKVKCSACGLIFRVFPPSAAAAEKGVSPEVELIVCDNCGTGFNMKQSLLQPEGTKVRCSKCKNVFIAFPSFTAPEPKSAGGSVSPSESPAPPDKQEPAAEKEDKTASAVTAEKTGDVSAEGNDLDFSLDEEEDEEDLSLDDENLDLEEDEELDLDLDLDLDEAPAAAPEEEAADEMDLDLDLDLEEDELEEETPAPDESSGDFELELAEDTIQVEDQEEPSGDLDIELDLDEDEEDAATGGDEEELDFSEVDSLLESDDVSVADTVEMATDDLDLDLEADDSTDGIEQQEIDLADLEQTIEMELLEPEEEDEEENEDVELELADNVGGDDLDEEITLDGDEEEDFSDIERMLEAGDEEEGEEDISLDFESDEAEAAAAAEPAGKTKKAKQKKEKKPKKEKKAKKEKKPAEGGRKSSRIVLIILIILLLLAVLGGGAYYLTSSRGIKIPFIASIIGPAGEQSPAGNVNVMQSTIESDFATNTEAGKLFIIKGTVKNDSLNPRKHILVQTRMYSQGHTLEATEAAYCGNILSPDELADSSLEAIQSRLSNKAGDNDRNLSVKPGGTIPFMIIVPKLPENLVEYEVLVAESASVE